MKNKKKTAKVVVSLVLVVAIVAAAVIFIKRETDNRYKAVIMDVTTAPITQTLSTTGKVESTNTGNFGIFSGVIPSQVLVKLGDKVEEGQLLATFEPDSLKGIVSAKQSEYDTAKLNYLNSVESANQAKAKIPEIELQIAQANSKIKELEAVVAAQENGGQNAQAEVPEWVEGIDYSALSKLLLGSYSEDEIKNFFAQLASKGASRKSISDIIDSMTSGASLDITQMLGTSSEEADLMSAKLNVMSLQAQKSLLETQSQNILGSTYESLMNTAKENLDSAKAAVQELSKGWYAKGAGVVSELNIVQGVPFVPAVSSASGMDMSALLGLVSGSSADLSGILSSLTSSSLQSNTGIKIEYYDSFIASFSLGKSDILDVQVGKAATIESIGKEYEGEVIFISPVATSGTGIDIGSLMGSMTGGSTSTGSNSIPAKVLIKNPDERIIVGIDVNIDIIVDTVENAVVVPIEAVETSSSGNFVYKYDEASQTVKRVEVEIGLASDTQYQILSGIQAGDKIVQNQSTALQEIAAEGEKVVATPYESVTAEAAV